MRKKVIAFFLAILIIGVLCCEKVNAELSTDPESASGNSANFTLTIKSPIQNETINNTNVNLKFSINDKGLLLFVRSISYTVCLDGEIHNQTQQTINDKMVELLNETLVLYNMTQGAHIIKVNVTVEYDFYSISCGGPFNESENMSGTVAFFVHQEENNFVAQPTNFSVNIAIMAGAIAITVIVVIAGSLIWFRNRKSSKKLKQSLSL